MNPIDVMGDILKFKGFMSAPIRDKIKWLFVLYPFFVIVLLIHCFQWGLLFLSIFKRKFKKTKE